ncbi:putative acyl-CoA transferase/carnitine dehydratase [Variovorax sp. CF313]|jgi:crotonobetainyl-CoA:carnitine CoA-transferase CaiB-like acyl-CoA transferase|uniref:CaiB/BaiF CoA transferase family protein n=1 Tax=Variovorax sp. CF313 TaxID=1144315 RepID=UPI0002713759|nr:CoA transferase [Variovorax sp. CF313]EJL67749.1 putative acyl-CoA transferase/carnitine dehydratase [Variovorax sp. CF313]
MNEPTAPPPLQGIRVVELGNYIAGPGTAMSLGDLGAEMLKIESMEGDMARHTGHFGHAMLRAYNRSKKSIALDLRQPRGLEVARRLIAGADVVVQNLRPGAADALGLGAEALRAAHPGLVHVSISGFPADAPSRDRPGYDIAAQAESGLMSVTGEPQGLPQKVGATIIDTASVQVATQAILAALFRRERTGRGETIRVSLLEVALNLQLANWSDYMVRGVEPMRSGDGQPLSAPAADIFRTRDGMVVISAYVQAHWVRLCETIGCPELATEARFLTNELRVANRPAMKAAVSERLAHYGTGECVELLTRNNIVVGVVRSYADALAGADFRASRMVIEAAPNGGEPGYASFGLPYELCDTPRRRTQAAPAHGAHTEELLREAGYGAAEIEALREAGVVKGANPPVPVRNLQTSFSHPAAP